MTSENIKISDLIRKLIFPIAVLLFAIAFCALQVPATYKSVCDYFERRDWVEMSSEVSRAEYMGEGYDSDEGYYAEWQLFVSYEYKGRLYESKYPNIQETDTGVNGEQHFIGQNKNIVLNPDNPLEIGVEIAIVDLIMSMGFSILFVVAVVFAMKWVIYSVKECYSLF